jgi:KDO2-lipid IV(A) lauroyltransferase
MKRKQLKEISHLLEYLTLNLTLKLIRKLKRERALNLAETLGSLFYNIPRVKTVCEENLEFTGFNKRIGKESFKNFLKAAVDFLRLPNYTPNELKELFFPVDPSSVPEGGGFFLTAHVGNWEVMGALFSVLSGGKLAVVAKPLKNKRVNELINRIRESFGIRVIPTGNVTAVFREVKKGNFVGILLDQRPKVKEGVLTKFLGRGTYTNRGLAVLSLKTGKPVIPAFCFIKGDKYEIEVYEPIEPKGSVEELTQKYTEAVEKAVKKHPEQWFWFHRRWKNSPEFKKWKEPKSRG